MSCTRYAQPLVGTLFCRVALGQSSLMGRWVHSPNQCHNFIWFSAIQGMTFLSEWHHHFRYDNEPLFWNDVWPSFPSAFLSGASKIETPTELRLKSRAGGGVAARQNDYKKRKREKRQVKSLKLPMGELCLAALWQVFFIWKMTFQFKW